VRQWAEAAAVTEAADMVGVMEAVAIVGVISMAEATVGAISMAEATAFTVGISLARTTWAEDPHFHGRLRSEAREASATR
jgi:hypothetical protein